MSARKTLMLTAVAALAACNSGNARKTGALSVSAGAASTAPAAPGAPAAPAARPLPPEITLTSLSVAVRELELDGGSCAAQGGEGGGGASASPTASSASADDRSPGDSSSGDCEVEVGPFVAHLDGAALEGLAAGQLPRVRTVTLPAGSYSELEAKLCGIDPSTLGDEAQAALAAAMGGATVVLEGTYQPAGGEGAPVPFRIPVTTCAEIERHVNVTVDEQGAVSNLTLRVNLGAWFHDAGGNVIPPETEAGVAAIAANIAASLDLYDDEDHDGSEDE